MNSLYLDTNQMRSSKQLFLSIWYKEKENQKVQLVCQSSVSWYVPELRLKSKSANSFYGTSTHGELITQRSGGERTSSMNKNCECFSLTLLSTYTPSSAAPLSLWLLWLWFLFGSPLGVSYFSLTPWRHWGWHQRWGGEKPWHLQRQAEQERFLHIHSLWKEVTVTEVNARVAWGHRYFEF